MMFSHLPAYPTYRPVAMTAIKTNLATQLNQSLNLSGGSLHANTGSFQIIWDTGATKTITQSLNNFTGEIDWFESPLSAIGIASGLKILGQGRVNWKVNLNSGKCHVIEIDAYYCPSAQQRLLSLQQLQQHLCDTGAKEKLNIEITDESLVVRQGKTVGHVEYSPINNLPISLGSIHSTSRVELPVAGINACLTASSTQNISNAQKELLRAHFKLGHLSMQRIQAVLQTRALRSSSSPCSIKMPDRTVSRREMQKKGFSCLANALQWTTLSAQ
jgi:hypothetical protein